MNRRDVLEEVAAGRLAPGAASVLLDAPADAARTLRLRLAYQTIEVLADPEVPELEIAGGPHGVRREDDVVVVTAGGGAPLSVRANPRLEIEAEVVGGALEVRGGDGALRAGLTAGSLRAQDLRGAVDLRVSAGSARLAGAPRHGDWRIRGESATLELVLDASAGAAVGVTARHSRVDAPDVLPRSGERAVEIDVTFSSVTVRTA